MSRIILSYSLFDQNGKKFDRSGHDPFNKNPFRYWTNIPFITVLNKICFPHAEIYFYVPKNLEHNEMFFFLKELDKNGFLKLNIIDKQHSGTEPTIWRMKALWEDKDFCFCRDIDSIMTPAEIKSMNYFMANEYWIHNIRSVKQHNVEGTSIMAGLCGFNMNKIKTNLPLPQSFEKYEQFYKHLSQKSFFLSWRNDLKNVIDKNGHWGCDQETLISFFIKTRSDRVIKNILDTYSQPDNRANKQFKGMVKPNTYYPVKSIDINKIPNSFSINSNAINIANKYIIWSGQPVKTNGAPLIELLSLPNEQSQLMKKIITNNLKLKQFYL